MYSYRIVPLKGKEGTVKRNKVKPRADEKLNVNDNGNLYFI